MSGQSRGAGDSFPRLAGISCAPVVMPGAGGESQLLRTRSSGRRGAAKSVLSCHLLSLKPAASEQRSSGRKEKTSPCSHAKP